MVRVTYQFSIVDPGCSIWGDEMPTLPQTRCNRCRSQHRKCDMIRPICARCLKAQACCVYADSDVVTRLVAASDAPPLDETNLPERGRPLEDPDFMPTVEDFFLVQKYLGSQERIRPEVRNFLHTESIMADYFFIDPPLRLVLCAYAAHSYRQELPAFTVESYIRRARKSLVKFIHIPSLHMVQALNLLCRLADDSGQPEFSDLIFRVGIDMLIHLKMHIDPDSEFWRSAHLTECQKEDQRCAFYSCAYWLAIGAALGKPPLPFSLPSNAVKVPKKLLGTPYVHVIHVAEAIIDIRSYHSRLVSSPRNLIVSMELLNLNSKLTELLSSINLFWLLMPLPNMSIIQQHQILYDQLANASIAERGYMLQLTTGYFSAICLLHRPRIYLIAMLQPNSRYLQPPYAAVLESSLRQGVDAAMHMARLWRFLLSVTATTGREDLSKMPLFQPASWLWGLGVSMFENCILLWFVLSRVPSAWRDKVSLDAAAALEGIEVMLEFLSMMENNLKIGSMRSESGGTSTILGPIVTCVRAMVLETSGHKGIAATEMDYLELGMTVLSLSEEGYFEPVRTNAHPYAMMGLMGVDVLQKVRWPGECEDRWRQFWGTVNEMT
ncbi:hypothetical protein BC830DRAFT_461675 [Chytriomyces sp. MP71]|nr:hypothetical protein BC830DRAFT_461675 [Chytriomyces sp. MP71]